MEGTAEGLRPTLAEMYAATAVQEKLSGSAYSHRKKMTDLAVSGRVYFVMRYRGEYYDAAPILDPTWADVWDLAEDLCGTQFPDGDYTRVDGIEKGEWDKTVNALSVEIILGR